MGKIGKTSAYHTLDFFLGGLYLQLSVMLQYTCNYRKSIIRNLSTLIFMFVHNIELLSISSAFIFMFVHYIDKVELLIQACCYQLSKVGTLKKK